MRIETMIDEYRRLEQDTKEAIEKLGNAHRSGDEKLDRIETLVHRHEVYNKTRKLLKRLCDITEGKA
jgi:hypothetical protein